MVTARPVPSTSIAPPSRIQSARRTRQARALAEPPPDRVVAGQIIFAAPAVEAEADRREPGRALDHDRPGVAQPDVAEGLRDHGRERRGRPRRIRRSRIGGDEPYLLALAVCPDCRRERRDLGLGRARDPRPRARHGSESRSRRRRAAPIPAAGGASLPAHCPARERSRIARKASVGCQFGHSVDMASARPTS